MTPREKYTGMRFHSEERGIDFNLSYEEFLEMWLESGKWELRGKHKEAYQLCRYHDEGAYSVNNCYIGTVQQNQHDKHKIPDGETGEIIKEWLSGLYSQREIGDKYGLTQSTISKIVNFKRRTTYAT